MEKFSQINNFKAVHTFTHKKKIIYIGANEQEIIINKLEKDFECIIFSNAFQAFPWLRYNALTREVEPEAILCDFEYPGGNIFLVQEIIQSYSHMKHIPLILVSENHMGLDDRKKILLAGIDEIYALPISPDVIQDRILFIQEFKKSSSLYDHAIVNVNKSNELSPLKRMFDIIVSSILLILLIPVFLIIALVIKLESKGSVFYISKRAGKGYQIFDFLKFRSMRNGADTELNNLMHLNQYSNTNKSFIKITNDPRVTAFGKFLRKTSLDELPQLINVIKGDMSIVGNRPLPLYEAEMLTKDQMAARFLAPAGITGLWQITKRGKKEMSEKERMELDIKYAKNNSFFSDMVILLKTLPALFQKEAV